MSSNEQQCPEILEFSGPPDGRQPAERDQVQAEEGEMQQLQRCFQEAQAKAEAAEARTRELLAANADLQAQAQEGYASRQAAAARIADLEVRTLVQW